MYRQSNFNFWQNEPKFQRREFGCARDLGLDRVNNSLCAPAHWPTKSWHGAVPACPGLLIVRSDKFAVALCRGASSRGAPLIRRACVVAASEVCGLLAIRRGKPSRAPNPCIHDT